MRSNDERNFSLLIDVDGTLAEYGGPWHEQMPIADPLPSAVEAMQKLYKRFRIIIFSTRKPQEAESWLRQHGIPYDQYVQKPLNFLIIDDRALTFKGNWAQTVKEIDAFKPWHQEGSS